MKVALVNPPWTCENSVHSGCRAPHLPSEPGNDPVPLYPHPSSPDYRRLRGEPDDEAWERAHAHHLARFQSFSDIQEDRPAALAELEAGCCR